MPRPRTVESVNEEIVELMIQRLRVSGGGAANDAKWWKLHNRIEELHAEVKKLESEK